MKPSQRYVKGFTLVELLVVIAIIALLLSIILPSLQMAREQAKSVVCVSQLRQWGLAIHIYANENDDFMPPNFLYSQYFPYLVYEPPNGNFRNLGLLFDLGEIKEPKLFYCPSESNEGHKYDTSINPWLVPHASSPNEQYTRMSYYYYTRVEDVFWNPKLQFDRERAGKAEGYNHFVELSTLKDKAILSDNIYIPTGYPHSTQAGFNVLYADGGAKFWHDDLEFFEHRAGQIDLSAQDVYEAFDIFDENR